MEEFNKKTDSEILKQKQKAIFIMFCVTTIFGPIIILFFFLILVSISMLNIIGLLLSIAVFIPSVVLYEKCFVYCGSRLIYGRDVSIKKIEEEKTKTIIDENIDENVEGYILKNTKYNLTEAEVLDKILEVDENFSKTHFYSYTKNLFTLIQEAWSNNDYHKLRSFEGDRLFNNHKKEIIDLIKAKKTDVRDKIYIKGVLLKDFIIEDNKEILIVAITVSMRRVFNNEETRTDYPYLMAFSRNVGVKTNPDLELSTTNCFNCGAVIDVSDDGICNYCDTSLVSGEHEWVLVDLKLLSKRGEEDE